jgi:hypothetical protein
MPVVVAHPANIAALIRVVVVFVQVQKNKAILKAFIEILQIQKDLTV